ncbi:MAG: hypothetical protein AAFY73_01795 [Pseudomonadota bacterium]
MVISVFGRRATGLSARALAICALLLAPVFLVACQGAKDNASRWGAANYARFALNKPYTRVANQPDLGETNLLRIGKSTAYGPMIGSFRLSSDETVYRHFKPQPAGSSTVDLGLVSRSGESFVVYLTWMRVDASGIVRDVATGTVPGGSQRCLGFAGGIIRNCTDQGAQDQSLAFYDSIVRTREGQPITVWGPRAGAQPVVTAAGQKAAVADRSPEAIAQVQSIPGGL